MKKVYTYLVYASECSNLEKVLNTFRVNLNDWDKTRTLTINGVSLVNYTIICEESVYVSITNVMNSIRVLPNVRMSQQ